MTNLILEVTPWFSRVLCGPPAPRSPASAGSPRLRLRSRGTTCDPVGSGLSEPPVPKITSSAGAAFALKHRSGAITVVANMIGSDRRSNRSRRTPSVTPCRHSVAPLTPALRSAFAALHAQKQHGRAPFIAGGRRKSKRMSACRRLSLSVCQAVGHMKSRPSRRK